MRFRLRVSSGSDANLPRTSAYLRSFGNAKTARRVADSIRNRQSNRTSAAVLALGILGITFPTLFGVLGLVLIHELLPFAESGDMTPVENTLVVLVILLCAAVSIPFFLLAERTPDLLARRSARRLAEARRCVSCRYDMTSHASPEHAFHDCPECGSTTPVAAADQTRTMTP